MPMPTHTTQCYIGLELSMKCKNSRRPLVRNFEILFEIAKVRIKQHSK